MSRQVSASQISPQQFGRVAVLLGGTSAEREVSLKSGNAVLQALLGRGVNAVAVDPLNDLVRQLSETHFDRAFVVLHGRGGEDGTVQGLLEFMGIPYTGSNVMGSAIAMDKLRTKQILRACEIPTADWCVLTADNLDEAIDRIGLPMFLKPAREGSSIGMSKVMRAEELRAAYDVAAKADALVIAEPCLPGPEYTVAILGDRVLPTIRLETTQTFYDYEAKYLRDDTQYHIPCGLSAADEAAFGELCLQAFRQVGASGWGRVDYMMDERGVPRILEVNTVPGMTDHSLVPMAAKAAGIEFDQLVFEILAMTLQGESQ